MKHIAVYVRVSTKKQETESQEPDLNRWIATQPAGTPVLWYHDKFTGKTMDRPGFNKLVAAIGAGEVSTVVIWRLDRLGRTAKGLTALFEDLQKAKVNLVSLKDSLDLSTAAGRLMANVLASVAAYETGIRGERVLAGQAVARANGKRWGGSRAGRLLHVTPEQLAVVQRMRAEGARIAAIGRAVRLSRPTVYRLVRQV